MRFKVMLKDSAFLFLKLIAFNDLSEPKITTDIPYFRKIGHNDNGEFCSWKNDITLTTTSFQQIQIKILHWYFFL